MKNERADRWRRALALVLVPLVLALFAYFIAPFELGDTRAIVPPGFERDAMLNTFVTAEGIDKLLTKPSSFYDTAILYPDRNQLRTTEPFLGYALLGLPLRVILHFNDADVFDGLRWLIVFASLSYAYLFFRAVGLGVAVSLAGAVFGWTSPRLTISIERLQILAIPLILAVCYHGLMAWRPSRWRLGHSAGLFVWAALYPLLGAINALVCITTGFFLLPLLIKGAAALRRERRFAYCLLPVLIAGAVDAVLLAPWLLDRADLAMYVSEGFLRVKHWNEMSLPAGPQEIQGFIDGLLGRGLAAGLLLLSVLVMGQGFKRERFEAIFWPLLLAAVAVVTAAMFYVGDPVAHWLRIVFHVVSWATVFAYWRAQLVWAAGKEHDAGQFSAMVGLGVGAFVCLMSFGPVYVSNESPLANHVLRMLLDVLPPLKSIREFNRLWPFGVLLLSVYVTVRLSAVLQRHRDLAQAGAVAMLVAAALPAVLSRELAASTEFVAPQEFVQLASHSRRTGAIYVHPYMKWNSPSGILMIAAARSLHRPIVNGYLGISPPYFSYARDVLHRFPDPQALWLLRKWKVDTVITLDETERVDESGAIARAFRDGGLAVWEMDPTTGSLEHPSEEGDLSSEGGERIEGEWSRSTTRGGITIKVPEQFETTAIQLEFLPVDTIPDRVHVSVLEGEREISVVRGQAGEWIQALAADALVHRKAPTATIRLVATSSRELTVRAETPDEMPIARVVLVGRRGRLVVKSPFGR